MHIDFFKSELGKVWERFNETFGRVTVCNIRKRQSVMLAIVSMGLLQNKISGAQSKDEVRTDIQRFVKTRNVLNNIFSSIENQQKERRDCVKSSHDGTGNPRRKGESVPALRQHIHN